MSLGEGCIFFKHPRGLDFFMHVRGGCHFFHELAPIFNNPPPVLNGRSLTTLCSKGISVVI